MHAMGRIRISVAKSQIDFFICLIPAVFLSHAPNKEFVNELIHGHQSVINEEDSACSIGIQVREMLKLFHVAMDGSEKPNA
jgi:hypothetical protein